MNTNVGIIDLADAGNADRARVGGKAGVLGELVAAGLAVPPGVVVTAATLNADGWETRLEAAAGGVGAERFAVRLTQRTRVTSSRKYMRSHVC
jgi:rifampicin phosphotransferase